MMSRLSACVTTLLCCVLLCGSGAQAETASRAAINLHHTSWTARDGAPPMALSITQTADGWLWLAAPSGLYRFDGIQFEQFTPSNTPLLTRNISLVNAFPDNVLWIGYRTGGAGRLQHGRIHNYGQQQGLPGSAVWGVERDSEQRIWAATPSGMYRLENEHWLAAEPGWQLPTVPYKTLMRDRQGVLWAQGDAGVYLLRPGSTHFERADGEAGTGVLFELAPGSVVSWNAVQGRFHQVAGRARDVQPRLWQQMGNPGSLLFDRHGDLWAGMADGVGYRTLHGRFHTTPAQGLSGRMVGALFEDREGNVWAATASGIDRFGRRRLSRIELPDSAAGMAFLADDAGGVWIGRKHVSVSHTGQVSVTLLWPAEKAGWASMLNTMARTSDGVLWLSSYRVLRRVQGGTYQDIALPPEATGVVVPLVLAEQDGSLLVSLRQHGLYRRKANGSWQRLRAGDDFIGMARTDAAGLWLANVDGRVLHADGAAWRSYGKADGLSLGLVLTLHLHGQHVWAGGENGLALRTGDRFRPVHGANGEPFDGISGIVELANGDLWLNAADGLFRIAGAELARFQQDQHYRVQYERLDQLDGLDGLAPRSSESPTLLRAADGRLWVIRTTGLFRLDPDERL